MRYLKRLTVCLFVVVVVSQFATSAEAARPNFLGRLLQHRRSVAPTYQQRYVEANSRYPKYIGAFHASYFQSIGVPPGDIGFRGNGLYVTPW